MAPIDRTSLACRKRVHHEAVLARLDRDQVLAPIERDLADRGLARHPLAHDGERFGGDGAVRREVVRPFHVHGIDQLRVGELHDVDHARRLRADLGDVVLVQNDVFALLELVALDEIGVGDLHLARRTPALLLNARPAFAVKLIETDGGRRVRGWEDTDGDIDQTDLEVALPGRARCHKDSFTVSGKGALSVEIDRPVIVPGFAHSGSKDAPRSFVRAMRKMTSEVILAKWREDPAKVRPMLASLDEPPMVQRGFVYEPKYDGIRALVDLAPPAKGGAPQVRIFSRNGNDKTAQFPAIANALGMIARTLEGPVLLDGEIVAVDGNGRPLGFQHIQGRIHRTTAAEIERGEREQPAILVLFDQLRDSDEDLRSLPLAARRLRLQDRVRLNASTKPLLRLSEMVVDDGRPLLERANKEGWEGLIVKDGQSVYQSGRRTPAWRKKKLLKQQEFVVGGWTEPRQSRQNFGALLVGYYDDDGRLRWAGSVGTGFNEAELARVSKLLREREIPKSPFADMFKTPERQHWVKPELVAEARFTEWTSDGLLRQPVYLGMRTDKKATDVVREEPSQGVKALGPRPKAIGNEGKALGEKPKAPGNEAKTLGPRPKALTRRESSAKEAGKRRGSNRKASVTIDADLASLLDVLTHLEKTKKDADLTLPNGDSLRFTNLAKVFWPKLGITKGELLRYYVQVSPMILPCVDDRPLVMKRFPNGVDGPAFYQQRHPEKTPPGVRREVLPEDIEPIDEEGPRDRLIGGSLTTLLYMTQLAAISQDPWFSRVSDPLSHDHTAIDLDPGEGARSRRSSTWRAG